MKMKVRHIQTMGRNESNGKRKTHNTKCSGKGIEEMRLEIWLSGLRALICSFRGPEFNSKQPHGSSQASVICDLMPSSGVSEDSYSVLSYNK